MYRYHAASTPNAARYTGGSRERVQHEQRRAVEFLFHVAEHVVRRQHRDRVAEVIAEHDGADREPADHQRRDGEQDQRQRDDPRALVRLVVMTVLVMIVLAVTVLAVTVMMIVGRKALRPWKVMNTRRKL